MFVIIILLSYFLIQRYLLAGCSFNCTAYVGQTDKLVACVCQLEVYSIQYTVTACMQYVIKGYKCFTMLRAEKDNIQGQIAIQCFHNRDFHTS